MILQPRPYQQKTRGYAHQEAEFQKSKHRKVYAFWWEMGTGKSKPIVDTIGELYCQQQIDGAVIFSDKGAYLNWYSELEKHLSSSIPRRVAHWSSSAKAKEVDARRELIGARDNCLDVLLVNIEALISDKCVDFIRDFIAGHYCLMAIDEATSIKNPKSQRTKIATKLGRACDYRRVLTGTPITQSPLDMYSMCDFLESELLGFPTFTSFRAYYATMIRMNLGPGRPSFDKIVGYRNLNHLTESLRPFSSRILKSECLDLPDKVYEIRQVELSDSQQKAYASLKQTAILQLEQGLLTSTSALTTINKLQQICCGHVKIDDKQTIDLDSNRVPVLLDLLDELSDHKVVIWCAFQRDVELITWAIREKYGMERGCVHYYGKTTDEMRRHAIHSFVNNPAVRYFVGTQATGGKGIDGLQSSCSYAIYYSNPYSLEDRLQSEDRLHRIGQNNKVTCIDLISPGTVDERVLAALKTKKDLSHEVLDRFRELI